jgi:hypothetical protein
MWLVLEIENNLLTGPLPPDLQDSRTFLTPQIVDELQFVEVIANTPGVIDKLVTINITMNRLYLINCANNYLTGSIPTWIFTSNVLTYVYLNNNLLSGSLPTVSNYSAVLSSIADLLLNNNYFTGTLSNVLLSQKHLVNLRLSYNHFQGSLSGEIFNNHPLIELAVDNNQFTGTLPTIMEGKSLSSLEVLSFYSNQFTGNIEPSYFTTANNLTTFAISSNCFSGLIPETICNKETLTTLILDGLSTAANCRVPIFPLIPAFDAFQLKHKIKNGIPSCLFEMPMLHSLYLSGNELTGSLEGFPVNVSSTKLVNLRLSFNRLTGEIPQSIQRLKWDVLDLSYNKLKGNLASSLFQSHEVNRSTNELYLDVNRLSGVIPSALRSLQLISILDSNLFTCGVDRKQLPLHDPLYASYTCSTGTMLQLGLSIGGIMVLLVLIMLWLKFRWSLNLQERLLKPIPKMIGAWNTAFIDASTMAPAPVYEDLVLQPTVLTDLRLNFEVAYCFLTDLRCKVIWLIVGCFAVLLPAYRGLNTTESMFTDKFQWEYSAIYMTGPIAGSVLFVLFICSVSVVYFLFYYQSKVTSTRLHRYLKQSRSFQSGSFDCTNCSCLRNLYTLRVLSLCIVLTIDVIGVSMLNIAYVIIVVYVRNTQALLIAAQLVLAMSKLAINEFFIWALLRSVKRFVYRHIYLRRHQSASENISAEETFVQTMTNKGMTTVVCALLFNNIVAPCLSVAVVSPSCFYNAFVAAPTFSAQYKYCSSFIRFVPKSFEGVCDEESSGTTSFSPPFIYSYNCASLLPVNYTAVFVYMAIFGGVISPLVKMLIKYVAVVNGRKDEHGEVVQPSWILRLPFPLRPLVPLSQILSSDKSLDDAGLVLEHLYSMRQYIFDQNRFVASYLAIFVSFGVLFPPLMLIIALAICAITFFEQWSIGDILQRSKALGYNWYWYKLSIELEGIDRVFPTTILPMMLMSCLLFSYLLFDTFGDVFGLNNSITLFVPIFLLLIPLILHTVCKYFVKCQNTSTIGIDNDLSTRMEMISMRSNPSMSQNAHDEDDFVGSSPLHHEKNGLIN